MMPLPSIGKRALKATGRGATTPAAAMGIGGMIAMGQQDMGTWTMDYMEDTLLGTTSADEAFTGAQRSITSPISMAAGHMAGRGFARGFNMLSPFPDISAGTMPPPLRYLSDANTAYSDQMGDSMSTAELGMRAGGRRYNRTPNEAIDGSMVFGMYNLRR